MENSQNNNHLPHARDWNHFWHKDSLKLHDQISWSKKRILTIVDPYIKDKRNILDAGCGSGFFSKYFCDKGLQAVALDYSKEALELTRKITKGRVECFEGDLLSPDIVQDISIRFECIFSDGLFEHFSRDDQGKIMRNFSDLLLPGGYVITFAPNYWSPWQLIRPFFMPGIKEKPFVLEELKNLHERQQLVVCVAGGINTLPIQFSPDKILGSIFGMILYVVAKKMT